jgi:hypothetical protein
LPKAFGLAIHDQDISQTHIPEPRAAWRAFVTAPMLGSLGIITD